MKDFNFTFEHSREDIPSEEIALPVEPLFPKCIFPQLESWNIAICSQSVTVFCHPIGYLIAHSVESAVRAASLKASKFFPSKFSIQTQM